MDTSEKIASLRSAFGLSQEELAARVGVARQTVVSWEQGARPSAFNRRRIIEEFALPSIISMRTSPSSSCPPISRPWRLPKRARCSFRYP